MFAARRAVVITNLYVFSDYLFNSCISILVPGLDVVFRKVARSN